MSYKDSTWLKEQYHTEKKSLYEIAKIAGTDACTVRYWMVKHKIPRRNRLASLSIAMKKRKLKIPCDELKRQYWEQGFSLKKIAIKYGVSAGTVLNRMKECGIEREKVRGAPIPFERYSLHESELLKGNCTEREVGYLIGIFDGEGATGISLSKRGDYQYLHPFFTISNTDEELMKRLSGMLGTKYSVNREKPKRKTQYIIRLNAIRDILEVLQRIESYLIVKRRQASLVIEFCKSRLEQEKRGFRSFTSREWEIYLETKKLNK
jgi:hypothetical protein